MGALQQVFAVQKEMVATDPMQAMVGPKQMYSALSDFVELNGLGDPDQYFLDPESPEGQQMAQMKAQQAEQSQQAIMQQQQQLQMQQKAQLQAQMRRWRRPRTLRQTRDLQNGRMKNEVDAIKASAANQIDQLEAQLKALKDGQDQELKRAELQAKTAIELTKLEVQANRDLSAQNEANKSAAEPAARGEW